MFVDAWFRTDFSIIRRFMESQTFVFIRKRHCPFFIPRIYPFAVLSTSGVATEIPSFSFAHLLSRVFAEYRGPPGRLFDTPDSHFQNPFYQSP